MDEADRTNGERKENSFTKLIYPRVLSYPFGGAICSPRWLNPGIQFQLIRRKLTEATRFSESAIGERPRLSPALEQRPRIRSTRPGKTRKREMKVSRSGRGSIGKAALHPRTPPPGIDF